MKTILIGTVIFVAWSSISTYYYVCQIKGLCQDEATTMTSIQGELPAAVPDAIESEPPGRGITDPGIEPEPGEVENEASESASQPTVVSPGDFLIHHGYNHQDFIQDTHFNDYLAKVEEFVSQNPETKIDIIGYADNIGPEEYNYELGLERANFIKSYMVKQGIPQSAITVSSHGESNPLESNDSRQGRAENRRTEIKIK